MIIYDCRDNTWKQVGKEFVAYLAPEQWFKITKSPDNKTRHFFLTDHGSEVIEVENNEEFQKQYDKLFQSSNFVTRTEWQVPAEFFESGCKHFDIKETN